MRRAHATARSLPQRQVSGAGDESDDDSEEDSDDEDEAAAGGQPRSSVATLLDISPDYISSHIEDDSECV